MKKYLILTFTILNLNSNAQQFKIETGEEFETPKIIWDDRVLDADNTGYYFLRNKNALTHNLLIHKIDKSSSKTIFIKEINFDVYEAFSVSGKLLLFSSEKNEGTTLIKKPSLKIILHELNSNTGEPLGEPIVVDDITADNQRQKVNFKISFSPDKKKMLLTSEVKENEKIQRVSCKLYDAKGYKLIWEKEPITIYKNSTVSSSQYMVDNNETLIYLFAYLRSEFKHDDGRDITYGVALSSVNKISKINEIPNKGITLSNVKIELINNSVICTGTFNDGDKEIALDAKRGFFLVSINVDGMEINTTSFNYFDELLQIKLISDKSKGTYLSWSQSKVFFINDAYYVVFQHEYTIYGTNSTSQYDDEILILKYNKQNKLDWMKLLPRNSSKGTIALNYLITDNLNLIYYDNPENLTSFPDPDNFNNKEYKSAEFNKSVVVCASLNSDGKITKKIVPLNGKVILDYSSPLKLFNKESKSLIINIKISKKLQRYDILKIE